MQILVHINMIKEIFGDTWKPPRRSNSEAFSEPCEIKPEFDCVYQSPIDLEHQTEFRSVPNQSVNDKYNQISV